MTEDTRSRPVVAEAIAQEGVQTAEKGVADRRPAILSLGEDVYPEGGWRAWCTVLGALLAQLCSYGYTVSFGVYQEYYTTDYLKNEPASAISWIGSVNAFLFEASGIVAGRLYDRGYFYHLVYGGCLMQSLSLFMLSLAKPDQYYQIFLAQGVASGISSGVLFIPTMAIASQYFFKRRALMMTLVSCGAALGSIVFPILLNNMLNGPNGGFGFATSVRASAAVVAGFLFIACCLMRTRAEYSEPATSSNYGKTTKRCFKDVAYMLGISGTMIFGVVMYYPIFYLQLDAVSHNIDSTFSFCSLVIMNASSFAGQLVAGFLAHPMGTLNVLIASMIGGSATIFGMMGLTMIPGVAVFAVVYGVFFGIFIAMWSPSMAALTPDHDELGVRMGMGCAGMAIGALVGTPISGALLGSSYAWWKPGLFNGAMGLVACALVIGMRLTTGRPHLRGLPSDS
ncbi:MFS general substrate transporter [Coniophora puteana RWD-64-598 SS2]|uniref:MFS general substrate transporter n=1 Tax=Coniophora puteana (strain RWD-64-598) TaxID=741705 RepID=A0A5M3MDS1_CONPW|nr:MFS general substrate transporter [Coniophora puteana RWD-64-598 SS2]EIW76994.1 MFS general substrate transporter [Coniophora puteana RWD-64-598 SS2]